ncbi:Nicotinamidase [Nodularia spumigena CCY9414]|jgi:hypothetical protein|nr:Nicotinamidase [Nodularia spumigena CCY9414]
MNNHIKNKHDAGEHPTPAATNITPADIENGIWKVNPSHP